jgi:hypothetical protein
MKCLEILELSRDALIRPLRQCAHLHHGADLPERFRTGRERCNLRRTSTHGSLRSGETPYLGPCSLGEGIGFALFGGTLSGGMSTRSGSVAELPQPAAEMTSAVAKNATVNGRTALTIENVRSRREPRFCIMKNLASHARSPKPNRGRDHWLGDHARDSSADPRRGCPASSSGPTYSLYQNKCSNPRGNPASPQPANVFATRRSRRANVGRFASTGRDRPPIERLHSRDVPHTIWIFFRPAWVGDRCRERHKPCRVKGYDN